MSNEAFPSLEGVPVLVDFETSILSRDGVEKSDGASPVERSEGLRARVGALIHPKNQQASRNVSRLLEVLHRRVTDRRPLIVGKAGHRHSLDRHDDHMLVQHPVDRHLMQQHG